MDISVILPTYHRDSYLLKTLSYLLQQKGDFTFEISIILKNMATIAKTCTFNFI